MSRHKETYVLSKRIAMTVALEAMQQLGWSSQPSMLVDTIQRVHRETVDAGTTEQWRVVFPLFDECRHMKYTVLVFVEATADRWLGGKVYATHFTGMLRGTIFGVDWSREVPYVKLEPFPSYIR